MLLLVLEIIGVLVLATEVAPAPRWLRRSL